MITKPDNPITLPVESGTRMWAGDGDTMNLATVYDRPDGSVILSFVNGTDVQMITLGKGMWESLRYVIFHNYNCICEE